VSAFASVITPFDATPAIELGNAWRKRILPVGSISYQGRTLNFTRSYLQGLVRAWQDRAYDAVPLQLADAANTHTNDPERTRGRITSMELGDDGLYVTAELTERGQRVIQENPYLGVSARIVEQYQRADGAYFPAAVQHVLATLDPRIPGLGSWEPMDMSNGDSALTIDLSNYHFAGEPAPAPAYAAADPFDGLTDAELGDLLDAMDEVGLLDGYDDTEATMYDDSYAAAAEQFDAEFTARLAADAAREAARAEFEAMDLIRPAKRAEDRMQRIMAKASHGLYDGQMADFTAEQGAVEIMMANGGSGPCGVTDSYGRCAERYHQLGCMHDQSVDWLASNPPRSTGEAALANLADDLDLNLARRPVWGDPDGDEPPYEMPAATIELAHSLATDWNLDGNAHPAPAGLSAYASPPLTPYDAMYGELGYELPPQPQPGYPGISELAKQMGLK